MKETFKKILVPLDQHRLLQEIAALSKEEQAALLEQLQSISLDELLRQHQAFFSKENIVDIPNVPLKECPKAKKEDCHLGQKALEEKKVATLLLAGGEGTRLGLFPSKGMCSIHGRSLFEIFYRKIKKHVDRIQKDLFSCVVTSPLNNRDTRQFFVDHHFFTLRPELVTLIPQTMLPFLDEQGNFFLKNNKSIAIGPDGNGGVFALLQRHGVLDTWEKEGIEHIVINNIDNPLADPFDPEMVGFHLRNHNEITLRAIPYSDNAGTLVVENDRLKVVEYHYHAEQKYFWGNSGIYVFSLDFMQKIARNILPMHFVKKKTVAQKKEIFAYKTERFIFDSFIETQKIMPLMSEAQKWFLPIKDRNSLNRAKESFSLWE